MSRTTVLCFLLVIAAFLQVIAQNVKVDPEVNGYEGDEIQLRCNYAGSSSEIKITQVVWAKFSAGKKQNIAVYNPQYGSSFPVASFSGRLSFRALSLTTQSLNDATLIIKPLKNDDDGTYSCEFATYPNGNEEGNVQLNILVKPNNLAEAVPVNTSDTEAVVATCTSANGKPPAVIRWESSLQGNVTSTSSKGSPNGTTTVTSQYRIVPDVHANQKIVTCIVEHKTMTSSQSFPVTLSIQYPPVVVIKGYDNNWYLNRNNVFLLCEASGNPPPFKYEWKLLNGSLPETVNSKKSRMTVDRVDATFNGTVVCEVTNSLGTGRTSQVILVRDVPQTSNAGAIAGGVIGAILGLLLIGLLVGFFLKKKNKETKGFPNYKTTHAEPPTQVLSYQGDYDVQKPLNAPNSAPLIQELPRSSDNGSMEKPKYELSDDEEEERFNEVGPMLRMSHHYEQNDSYMDDDMESQRDGSIISKTAVYV